MEMMRLQNTENTKINLLIKVNRMFCSVVIVFFILAGFTYFWGIVFFITTTIVWITKHERNELDGDDMGIIDAYRQLIKVIRLPAVLKYLAIALTCKV